MREPIRYRRLLAQLTLRNGTVHDAHVGDWRTAASHLRRCGMAPITADNVEEDATWRDYSDTFDAGNQISGVRLIDVDCRCGTVRGADIRWSASTAEVLAAVLGVVMEYLPQDDEQD